MKLVRRKAQMINIMKNAFKLAALFLLLGTSAFASAPKHNRLPMKPREQVSFIPLKTHKGFAIMVDKAEPGTSLVMIYDNNKNVVYKDCLTKFMKNEKKYIFTNLDDGDYTVEVYSKNHDIQTQFSVYSLGEGKLVHMN